MLEHLEKEKRGLDEVEKMYREEKRGLKDFVEGTRMRNIW